MEELERYKITRKREDNHMWKHLKEGIYKNEDEEIAMMRKDAMSQMLHAYNVDNDTAEDPDPAEDLKKMHY